MPFDSTGFQTETKPREEWRNVLDRAADYIEEHGFGKGDGLCDPLHGYCVVSAASMVTDDGDGVSARIEAYGALAKFLGLGTTNVSSIVQWNDHPARTAAEVVAALREAARS